MRKFVIWVVVLQVSMVSFWGCQWLGRTAGKIEKGTRVAADKIEDGAENTARRIDKMERDFEKGYEDGRR